MNIILQHWHGTLPNWAQAAKRTMETYARAIGCEYELVTGYPLGENLGKTTQKLSYLLEKYDRYNKVLMLDMDIIATSVYDNVFDRNEIGVLHHKAMNGNARTSTAAPELFTKGMFIFYGNYVMTTKDQRQAMRKYADWDWLSTKITDDYSCDEMIQAWLMNKSMILENLEVEKICMRCTRSSNNDIVVRDKNRWDKKFSNLPEQSDKDATFLHFCGTRKKKLIPTVRKIFKGL